MRRIWLIGGTSESKQLAIALQAAEVDFIITVTTASALHLYPNVPSQFIHVGKLDRKSIDKFIQAQQITAILDASHPFATEISAHAIAVSQAAYLPYLRFERPEVLDQNLDNPWVIRFTSFTDLLKSEYLANQRILLTIGYQSLKLFEPWQQCSMLFARILPSTVALEAAQIAGFTAERLIAIRPPISLELETSLIKQWQITTIITKASGQAGGEDIKTAIATSLQIPLLIIDRPKLNYPRQTNNLEQAVQFCQRS